MGVVPSPEFRVSSRRLHVFERRIEVEILIRRTGSSVTLAALSSARAVILSVGAWALKSPETAIIIGPTVYGDALYLLLTESGHISIWKAGFASIEKPTAFMEP
jgi:hypothetical protein